VSILTLKMSTVRYLETSESDFRVTQRLTSEERPGQMVVIIPPLINRTLCYSALDIRANTAML